MMSEVTARVSRATANRQARRFIAMVALLGMTLMLTGCGGSSSSQTSPPVRPPDPPPAPPPSPLVISTASLPYGRVGQSYSATLTASGGTPPYHWSVTGGSVPAGLGLNAASGTLSGSPAADADHVSLTFELTDSSASAESASVTLPLTVSPASISVSVSPRRAGLTIGQPLGLTATTSDLAGVAWSVSPAGPTFATATSTSGQSVTLNTSQTAGAYTVTATSITDPTQSESTTVGITDLPGVFTYHDDPARDGANDQEYALTPTNINSSAFGKLFSCTVDGAIYAQPLWVANLKVNGTVHNVVLVATQHDSLYAFDADANPCEPLWQVSLIDSGHGGTGGEVTVPSGTSGYLVGGGDGDITPEVGVTGTPVIDPAAGILYVVSMSMNAAATSFHQRLHAIDITSGAEKPESPVTIAASFPGTGSGGSTVTFDPRMENQRPGLALVGGAVYIGWGSHEDTDPWYGWLIGYTYNGGGFTQTSVLNATPNHRHGGIWMSGAAPAADSQGRIYVVTGNGVFDASSSSQPNDDYGDSMLQLSAALGVLQYFTPSDQATDELYNNDFGAGGAAVLVDLPSSSPVQHLIITGGKDGSLYVLDRDALGGYGDGNAWQEISIAAEGPLASGPPGVLWGIGAVWNDSYYLAGAQQPLTAYRLDPSTAKLSLAGTASAPSGGFGWPASTPSVSASGDTNGVVWAIDNSRYCTNQSPGCGPAVLHAYNASNVAQELWNSSQSTADQAGNAVKFVVPTIANGKVYVATRGNNTGGVYGSTSASGELDVYGLKP